MKEIKEIQEEATKIVHALNRINGLIGTLDKTTRAQVLTAMQMHDLPQPPSLRYASGCYARFVTELNDVTE